MNPRTILCIDDDNELRDIISKFMQSKGYRTITCSDGWDGLREIIVHRPDLILMDVNMPKMDGLHTLEMMKATRSERYVPIILVSGEGDRETITKAGELGADDFVVKPFNFDDLYARVQKQLFTVDFPILQKILSEIGTAKPATSVAELDMSKYAHWTPYLTAHQNIELCVLLPDRLVPADALALDETEAKRQIVVLKKTRVHWRAIWPAK